MAIHLLFKTIQFLSCLILIRMKLENQNDKLQEIKEILRKKESLIAVRPKGRMVVKRPRKSKSEQDKIADALVRAKKKLGKEETASMRAK